MLSAAPQTTDAALTTLRKLGQQSRAKCRISRLRFWYYELVMLWFTLWSSFRETSELYAFCHGAQLQGVAVLPVSHYVICYGIKILGCKHELLLATGSDGRNILSKHLIP